MTRAPRGKTKRAGGRTDIEVEYRVALLRAVIHGVHLFAERTGRPPARRGVVNFLRGNQLPGPGSGVTPADAGYGLLDALGADFVDEAVDRLIEEGYLGLASRSGTVSPGLTVTDAGRRALAGDESIPPGALPEKPRLGAHPEVEERLRRLRRDLARAEGRSAFGIFPNRVLAALAAARPRDLAALASVPGLGPVRIRKYGRKILGAIQA